MKHVTARNCHSRSPASEEARDAAVVKALVKQILVSLRRLHRMGIVHRDIKPVGHAAAKSVWGSMVLLCPSLFHMASCVSDDTHPDTQMKHVSLRSLVGRFCLESGVFGGRLHPIASV